MVRFQYIRYSRKLFGKGRVLLLLSELLKDWPCTVLGSIALNVCGISERSRAVKAGDIFVARKGACDDGILYVEEAIQRGAVAVVIDRNSAIDFKSTFEIPLIIVPDGRKFISHASAKLCGDPSESLTIIAVTGTNGKTTVTHFIGQLLCMRGEQAAVIGTTGVYMNGKKIDLETPDMTTLPAEYLQPLLKMCLDAGMTHVVLEASSLGLSTSRLDHCEIDIGVFLNIGVDHYEEHGSKEAYLEAKKKLSTISKELIVNVDDPQCVALVRDSKVPIRYFNENMTAGLEVPQEYYPNTLLGKHNKSNALAAVSVMMRLGHDQTEVLTLCDRLQLPEGRLQRIQKAGVTVYIDYAHTPDALQTVLTSLVAECHGKDIITVFGCGGNRDRGKRPQMGKVAVTYSSKVIITSDNPRYEDPSIIIHEILSGVGSEIQRVTVEPNRKKAIQRVINESKEGDIILIAGKGHEKIQQIGSEVYNFSDYEIAEMALQNKI